MLSIVTRERLSYSVSVLIVFLLILSCGSSPSSNLNEQITSSEPTGSEDTGQNTDSAESSSESSERNPEGHSKQKTDGI